MIPDELVDAFVQAAWGTDDPPALEALKRRDARRGLEAIFASVDVLDLLVQAGLVEEVGHMKAHPLEILPTRPVFAAKDGTP